MTDINAQMAGTIQTISVKAGDSVTAGQELMVMESMKMNIPIEASGAGTVKEIKVNEGEFVNASALLAVIE